MQNITDTQEKQLEEAKMCLNLIEILSLDFGWIIMNITTFFTSTKLRVASMSSSQRSRAAKLRRAEIELQNEADFRLEQKPYEMEHEKLSKTIKGS